MHPIAGFLSRADAAATELIELIEFGQLDLELQRHAVAVAARQWHIASPFAPADGLDGADQAALATSPRSCAAAKSTSGPSGMIPLGFRLGILP